MSATNEIYDLAIIGGGTNGPAIFLTALTSEFKKVILIEQGLVGRGRENRAANGASLGMIQPGLKYVMKDINIMETDALDCRLLKVFAEDFLEEREFILPIYGDYEQKYLRQPFLWDVAFGAYDRFSKIALHRTHRKICAEDIRELEPNLRRGALKCAFGFSEWLAEPVALSAAFARAGKNLGGKVLEGCEVRQFTFENGCGRKKVRSAIVEDACGRQTEIRAKYFVNACGAWAPKIAKFWGLNMKLRLTSGVSLILKKRLANNPVVVFGKSGEYCAFLPFGGNTLVGPTNHDVAADIYDNPDLLQPAAEEQEELLTLVNRYFGARLSEDDIIGIRRGLRPQLNHRGVPPYDVTHEFSVFDHNADGLANAFSVAGGKLTCQMRIAKEVMEKVCAASGINFFWRIPFLKINRGGELAKNYSTLLNPNDYREKRGLELRPDADGKKIFANSLGKEMIAKGNLIKCFFIRGSRGEKK